MLLVNVACKCCCFAVSGCQAMLSRHRVVWVKWWQQRVCCLQRLKLQLMQLWSSCLSCSKHLTLCFCACVCRRQRCCSVCWAQDSGRLDSQSLGARCAGELAPLPILEFWMIERCAQQATSYQALNAGNAGKYPAFVHWKSALKQKVQGQNKNNRLQSLISV